ncbi:lytic transglycosylase domain-containing protein [Paraglaciecola hydrolytica]|uniref:Transglycosylase SLT domain-containing protein n=1 Tax=Paraglaciecola hydrolytica TaxID=1799789 RepID=A0A135ZZ07_9ALTE|nr:lytic transglycosylase domain-containing protein [Paraglaciecola hydrolytica]KXI28218.1 hypothetical protein AX660_17725 [Paraglaciecola hydrolytica]
MNFHFSRLKVQILLSLILASVLSFNTMAAGLSQQDIQQMLIDEALKQNVEPALVLAIAKVESDFNPMALSHAGAKGVMQIMPATAKNGFNVASHDLYQPQINIRVGVAYIKQLLEQYQGKLDIALSHYNGGSAVKRPNGQLRVIPATHNYVNKVKLYAQRYQQEADSPLLAQQTKAVYAHTELRNRGRLSYAQQMAQDETSAAQLNSSSVQNITNKPATMLNVAANEGRIDELQQLRVHNLTRILGPKKQKPMDDYSANLMASQDSWNMGVSIVGTVRNFAQLDSQQSPPAYGSKQQKVASWEAIFD